MNNFIKLFENFTIFGNSDDYLDNIMDSYKNDNITRDELKFLFTINYNSSNNLLQEEKLIITNTLIISVVKESGRNQGQNETSYFKVYRYPSNASENDDCLRISFFEPTYELGHKHTYKKLLDRNEKENLINILSSTYQPNPRKHQELTQYNIMLQIYTKQLNEFYEHLNNKKTEIIYPKLPTIWIAALYYFNFVNDGKPNISLLQQMPNYIKLPIN